MNPNVEGLHAEILEQPICDTLELNYMPYAMSVIVSRAIPEIDGFKPSHRKLLYTMYKMGLLNGGRTKSANIVGQTMRLNPHGDAAIYETMVRLARGYEALLHPFVDSKGNFGKVYSRDMAYAASRYTEAKLDPICQELFRDIDADTVDFIDNYDNSMLEPTLLPTTFPNVLVTSHMGFFTVEAMQAIATETLENAYAVDRAEATIMGYRSVPLLDTAEALMPGITESEYPLLRPDDLTIDDYKRIPEGRKSTLKTLFIPNLLSRIGIQTDGRPYPSFMHDRCRHCQKCVRICPAKALEMRGNKVHIRRSRCIRCYCCHEMCPFDAIDIS